VAVRAAVENIVVYLWDGEGGGEGGLERGRRRQWGGTTQGWVFPVSSGRGRGHCAPGGARRVAGGTGTTQEVIAG
jgi:hypothetical protein